MKLFTDDDNLSKDEYRRFLLDFMDISPEKVDKITEDGYNAWSQVNLIIISRFMNDILLPYHFLL